MCWKSLEGTRTLASADIVSVRANFFCSFPAQFIFTLALHPAPGQELQTRPGEDFNIIIVDL